MFRPLSISGLIVLCSFLLACSGKLSQATLDAHVKSWRDANIAEYSYDLVRHCFCDGSGKAITVHVKDSAVVSARYGDATSAAGPPRGMTVPEIYELMRSAIQDKNVDVTARFSDDGKIPTEVLIKHHSAMDGAMTIQLSNFRKLD